MKVPLSEKQIQNLMDSPLSDTLEEVWNQKSPGCLSCGWTPAFYEVEDHLDRAPEHDTDFEACFYSQCISINDEDGSHRGHYLYVPFWEVSFG